MIQTEEGQTGLLDASGNPIKSTPPKKIQPKPEGKAVLAEKKAILEEIESQRKESNSRAKLKTKKEVFAYYWVLRLEYISNKAEFNKTSHTLTKKVREKCYLALVYKQACIKTLEFTLGLDLEEKLQESEA